MGFHSFLQAQGVPMESAMAKAWNNSIFRHIRRGADAASVKLAQERGACPDAAENDVMARFSHKLAIAPTASISIICGGTCAGIEPIPANIYTHKTLSGSFAVKNPYLERLLDEKGKNTEAVWSSILEERRLGAASRLPERRREGRVQDRLRDRPALDHRTRRRPHAAHLPEPVAQLFLPGDVDKWDLHMLHWMAWERGVKSLYYCRSKACSARASPANESRKARNHVTAVQARTDYEECLACQ